MTDILAALAPVILVIIVGLVLKRSALLGEAAWVGIENLCYYVLFPALLVKTLATADVGGGDVLAFVAMVLFAIFAMSVLMWFARGTMTDTFGATPAAFASLFQGATRWHGFIALSIAGFLLGDEAIAYMAITMAVIIPPLNIINVMVLGHLVGGGNGVTDTLLKLARNPFVLACLVGSVLNLSGIGLPGVLFPVFDMVGSGALGVSMLVVGAGLQFRRIMADRRLVVLGTAIRLVGMPALMFIGAALFGIDGMPRTVAIIASAVPTAASGYVLSRQMGGDAPLMANLITVQVVASTTTLPLMIWIAQSL